jgi:transcriptional regulator with XRE-family HTH domain
MFDCYIMEVGERIKELRKNAGLTQQQLADKIGITYIQVGRYETGKPGFNYTI